MGYDDDDDILAVRQAHPVVTTLLLLGCVALITAITLSVNQLKTYVSPEVRDRLGQEFVTKPAVWAQDHLAEKVPARPAEMPGSDSGLSLETDE